MGCAATANEDWVSAAMSDDTMVVELLVRLHNEPPPPPPPKPPTTVLPLEWSVRQRRSKSVSTSNNPKKPGHGASPTTPLSWSGGATSVSGGSGGAGGSVFEESSPPPAFKLSNSARSKVNGESEKTAPKRLRKKKTLAELREDENSLIKERRELKKQLADLRVNLEKQRATNESLKRMKLEYQPQTSRRTTTPSEESVSGQLQQMITAAYPRPTTLAATVSGNNMISLPSTSYMCPQQNKDVVSDSKFVLPDLNMPLEE